MKKMMIIKRVRGENNIINRNIVSHKNYHQPSYLLAVLLLTFLFLLLTVIFNSSLISAQTATYCAEKTTDGKWCQSVPQSQCATGTNPNTGQAYRCDRTACGSTTYCSVGTCVDNEAGNCLPSPQATCNPSEGGDFYDKDEDEVPQCKVGCCLLGDGAILTKRIKCDVLGKDYNLNSTFRSDITNEEICLALSSPDEKGACVFETDERKSCRFGTRKECANGNFSGGFLCTAPELGTICAKTKGTVCVPGKNEVYFVDSCGNLANVYDANKIDDIAYWSFVPGVEGVEVDLGDGKGNKNSATYGSCDYFQGSTCGPGNAKYGRNICVDLSCPKSELTGDIKREHGESWCAEPIKNFEGAKPGKLSVLLYCYNGEVQYEVGDNFRNKLCLEGVNGSAGWIVNDWANCFSQENTKDCNNLEQCKVIASEGLFPTRYGDPARKLIKDSNTDEFIKATCVPKYTPGFKFWDPEGTIAEVDDSTQTPTSICQISSVICVVPYTQEIAFITNWHPDPVPECLSLCEKEGGKDCRKQCTPVCFDGFNKENAKINSNWAANAQNLCVSMGDCGVSANYLGKEGYNKWRDLFKGEQIDWSTLPNAQSKTSNKLITPLPA